MSIRLGAALPERVATRIQRLLGAAPDTAAAVRFLAGPEASYITVSVLKIDGGIL